MSLDPVFVGDPLPAALNEERAAINALQVGLETKISLPAGAATGDLLRWDGTQWLTTETRLFEGEGDPNGVVSGPLGSRYIDKTGTSENVEWLKRTGADGNTGWVATGGVSDTGWLEVGAAGNALFGAGWSHYPGGFSNVAYRKRSNIVYLKGLASCNTNRNTRIFTLPPGYRVTEYMHMSTMCSGNVTSDLSGFSLYPNNGEVVGRPSGTGWVALDGVSFIPDA